MAESMLEVYMYVNISSTSSLNILRTLLHTGMNLDLETHGTVDVQYVGMNQIYVQVQKTQNYV